MDQISEVVPVSPNLSRESGMQKWTLHLFTQQETKQSSEEETQVSFIPLKVINRFYLLRRRLLHVALCFSAVQRPLASTCLQHSSK